MKDEDLLLTSGQHCSFIINYSPNGEMYEVLFLTN